MKKIANIIFGDTEPSQECLWIHVIDGSYVAQIFTENGWATLGDVEVAGLPSESAKLKVPVFYITYDDEALEQKNLQTAAEIGHNAYRTIELKGELYGDTYDITGYFYDGIIHTILGDFDVNYDTGVITMIYSDDNTTAAPLQVADADTPEAGENLKILMEMSIYPVFLCRFASGYGTATFNSENGGSAFITTANGIGVKYSITKDGVITKVAEYDLTTNIITA